MARILAFTDPHGEVKNAEKFRDLARSEKPNLLLCSGDLTLFGGHDPDFFKILSEIGRPIYFIPGNHDDAETVSRLVSTYSFLKDLSYRVMEDSGLCVGGLPGNDLAFWPGESSKDDGTRSMVRELMAPAIAGKTFILLAHYPPSGCGAVDGEAHPTPDSGGNALTRLIVEDLRPKLVLVGHYHQCFGQSDFVGSSRIVNPGPSGSIISL